MRAIGVLAIASLVARVSATCDKSISLKNPNFPTTSDCYFIESEETSFWDGATCRPNCAKGEYDLSGTCTPCPPGTYNPCQKARSQGDCQVCPSGKYRGTPGATAEVDCLLCSSGEYSLPGSQGCKSCPAGKYEKEGSCEVCPVGKYSAATADACTPCEIGKFQDVTSQGSCKLCMKGTYSDATALVACKACAKGTYSTTEERTTACDQCLQGQYQNLAGQTECSLCLAGSQQNSLGAASITSCINCVEGKYADVPGQALCQDCPDGAVAFAPGMTKCAACDPGSYANSKDALCISCPIGKHQPQPGQTECLLCGPQRFQNIIRSASCTIIPSGFYGIKEEILDDTTSEGYKNYCAETPFTASVADNSMFDGTTTPGKYVQGHKAICACRAGEYCLGGSSVPVKCPVGHRQPNTTRSSCEKCPSSMYQDTEGQIECKVIPEGKYGINGLMKSCVNNAQKLTYKWKDGLENLVQGNPGSEYSEKSSDGYFGFISYGINSEVKWPPEQNGKLLGVENGITYARIFRPILPQTHALSGHRIITSAEFKCVETDLEDFDGEAILGSIAVNWMPHSTNRFLDAKWSTIGEVKASYVEISTALKRDNSNELVFTGPTLVDHITSSNDHGYGFIIIPKNPTETESAVDSFECTFEYTFCTDAEDLDKIEETGHTNVADCSPGNFCSGNSFPSRKCVAGKYQDESAKSECKGNSAGYYSAEGSSAQVKVTDGHYTCNGAGEAADLDAKTVDATHQCICPKGSACAGYDASYGAANPVVGKVACQKGYHAEAEGLTSCKACSLAQYQDEEGKSNCKSIPVGSYGTSKPADGWTSTAFCEKGYTCAGGSGLPQACPEGSYQPEKGQSSCINCPVGKYQDTEGSSMCKDVPAGYYDPKISGRGLAIIPCEVGYICPALRLTEAERILCPAGKFQNTRQQSICKNCGASEYSPTPTSTAPNTRCHAVAPGYYGVTNAEGLFGEVRECTPGEFCVGKFYPNQSCPVGTHSPSAQSPICTDCPKTHYQDKVGQAHCIPVEPGYYGCAASSQTVYTKQCTCANGTMCAGGSAAEISCAPGTFQPLEAQTSCTKCENYEYQPESRQLSCIGVPAGYEGVGSTSDHGNTGINGCIPGTYCTGGSATSQPCAIGKFQQNSLASSCSWCPDGKFQSQNGAKLCNNCGNQSYSKGNTTAQKQACELIGQGYYGIGGNNGETHTERAECPKGYKCTMDLDLPEPCPQGEYQDLTAQVDCKICPAYMYQDLLGASECKTIPDGYYGWKNSLIPQRERIPYAAEFNQTNQKVNVDLNAGRGFWDAKPCEVGYRCNPKGQTPRVICAPGTYSPGSVLQCTDCEAGKFQRHGGRGQCDYCGLGSISVSTASVCCTPCSGSSGFNGIKGETACTAPSQGFYTYQKNESEIYKFDEGVDDLASKPCKDDNQKRSNETYHDAQKECEVGHYCRDGIKTACPVGKYQPYPGRPNSESNNNCYPCAEGFTTLSPGQSECVPLVESPIQASSSSDSSVPASLIPLIVVLVILGVLILMYVYKKQKERKPIQMSFSNPEFEPTHEEKENIAQRRDFAKKALQQMSQDERVKLKKGRFQSSVQKGHVQVRTSRARRSMNEKNRDSVSSFGSMYQDNTSVTDIYHGLDYQHPRDAADRSGYIDLSRREHASMYRES